MEMSKFDLDSILKVNDVSKESLNRAAIEEHRKKIAQRIGGDWETLATFIGVSSSDVDDIKEEHRKPLDRRLAMMRRWHELLGEEATYLRLVNGLKELGRRNLIEYVLDLVNLLSPGQQPARLLQCNSRFSWLNTKNMNIKEVILMILCVTIILYVYYYDSSKPRYEPIASDYHNTTNTVQSQANNDSSHPQRIDFNHTRRNCSFPESDLPIIHPLFVGRENDMYQLLDRVARAHIVNINGAPGFGKSTLAIHIGYEIVKNGSSVRYINVEDKVSFIVNQRQRSEGNSMSKSSSNTNMHQHHQAQKTSLTQGNRFSRFSLSVLRSQILTSKNENLFDELQRWSETIKCTTVLILDNCDDVLVGRARHEFLSLINSLITKSHFILHIVIVSHERLLYLDSFDVWTVRELNQSASVQLLDKLAPAIDNESLTSAAELVEGCPLALKVIGQLLQIYGAQLIHKMKNELIATLDKASIQEQRFPVIMDAAFNRLGDLKRCGYMISLFPGSFDDRAGNAIIQEMCLETYLKYSLVDDYFHAFNYRYKMHRLIKEYLQEKISIDEKSTFITRFKKYFETLLLTYATKEEIDDTDKYTLSLELHNLYYLSELLLTDIHSSKELAVLAFLYDMKLIQVEQLHRYYAQYIKKAYEVCQLLNSRLCGQVYTNVVKNLYQQCRCGTLMAYIQNFFNSPCMEYFQCKAVVYLQYLHISGVLNLSDIESSYIDIIVDLYCYRGFYHTTGFLSTVLLDLFEIIRIFLMFFALFIKHSIISCVLVIFCICELILLIIFYQYNIKIAPYLRILEITLKWICQNLVFLIVVGSMRIAIRLSWWKVIITAVLIIVLYYSVDYYTHIHKNVSVSRYCCWFIPICV